MSDAMCGELACACVSRQSLRGSPGASTEGLRHRVCVTPGARLVLVASASSAREPRIVTICAFDKVLHLQVLEAGMIGCAVALREQGIVQPHHGECAEISMILMTRLFSVSPRSSSLNCAFSRVREKFAGPGRSQLRLGTVNSFCDRDCTAELASLVAT